jgi:hypothetical protein
MGIPASLEFKTKPELGLELLAECITTDVQVPWCTADAVYGRDRKRRGFCKRTGIGYVLGVPCSFQFSLAPGITMRADATLKLLNRRAWQVHSCGPGSKGERRYAWPWLGTATPRHFLLIRGNRTRSSRPT